MNINKSNPFGMPVIQGNPAYCEPPNRFINREYFIIAYETDPDALKAAIPPGLEYVKPIVKFEFMKMPDSCGFGDFSESGQAIPVSYEGKEGTYIHSMFLNCHPPIAGGREIWGFPKTYAHPKLEIDSDTLLGTLDYGKTRVATGTMWYKYKALNNNNIKTALGGQNFLVKTIPNVDGTPAICQLVRYYMTDINVKWAYEGPAALEFHAHAMANLNALPIKKVISATHFCADLTLPYGEVAIDYLKN